MKNEAFEDLFSRITEITGITDIGYHEIVDGKLSPVYKTNTEALGIEPWKKTHAEKPVYIKNTAILQQIVDIKEAIAISDTKNNSLSAEEFFFFGIDSVLVVPVIKEDRVKGIVSIASIGRPHQFSNSEIDECVSLIKTYI